jgi:predicted nucleic acid-binding protein
MFLLDTNVVSELRKPRPNPQVRAWVEQAEEATLFLSAVTLGEIQAGIEAVRERDAAGAQALAAWADQLAQSLNVLPMDAIAFRQWARLMHGQPDSLYEDAMIAATAQVHQLKVVTRNVRDFARLNVDVVDPFRGAVR